MEILDLYNSRGERLRRTVARGEWRPEDGGYVKIVHVILMNGKGEVLIQQRAFTKKVWPGQWTLLGGFVVSGEEPEEAVIRETAEEYGVDVSACPRRRVYRLVRESRGCIMEFWMVAADVPLAEVVRQVEEVEAVAYETPERLYGIYSQGDRWVGEEESYRRLVLNLIARIPEMFSEFISDV